MSKLRYIEKCLSHRVVREENRMDKAGETRQKWQENVGMEGRPGRVEMGGGEDLPA